MTIGGTIIRFTVRTWIAFRQRSSALSAATFNVGEVDASCSAAASSSELAPFASAFVGGSAAVPPPFSRTTPVPLPSPP